MPVTACFTEVFGTDEFRACFLDLSAEEQAAVVSSRHEARDREISSVALGRPHTASPHGHEEAARRAAASLDR